MQAGNFTDNNQEVRVDAGNVFTSREDLEAVVVGVVRGQPVYLRDVADKIVDGAAEPTNYVVYGTAKQQARRQAQYPAVTITVAKRKGICGGSAIAAIAPITNASEEEIAVSLGTVFLLNSVALLAFPPIGNALHLTQTQFGLWSALAIHDTSSVVGATAKFGAVALAIGTTVKLARALWIVPVSIGTAIAKKSKARIQWPWFILFFCLAAVANTYVHAFQTFYPNLKHLGVIGLTVTLFLIGTGLSKRTLQEVGARPLLQGVLLWIVVAVVSLSLICGGWIHL